MSWATAKRAAKHFLRQVDLPEEMFGATIRLSEFPDQATKDFLRPDDLAWSLEFHNMVNRAIARDLRKRGATVSMVLIELNAYFDWLVANQKENTPATRAEYISWKTK